MSDDSRYPFSDIEAKWRTWWDEQGTYRTLGPGDHGFNPARPKYYVLDMFPYPSGKGLHVGHPLGYIATDIVARYKRMRGFNVLHPMGFDAFGLPAEQYAIEHNVHPRLTTMSNVDTIRRQLRGLSLGYDWEREITTIDPDYYRWTQWIFLQLYHSWFDPRSKTARAHVTLVTALDAGAFGVDGAGRLVAADDPAMDSPGVRRWDELSDVARRTIVDAHRLAYLAEVPVNWCPRLGTVLANEEVTADGRSERGNFPVYKRPLKQWMLRITAYADRLVADLDDVDWPESLKTMQRNWIGRSEGALVDFALDDGSGRSVRVFTTRPDTLFGATYVVLAPDHPLVGAATTAAAREAVNAYRAAVATTAASREAEQRAKTGVFTGGYALNPANGARLPIWVADYVLMGYGTGAIMAVPAHDQRDFEFAWAHDLPIEAVVLPDDGWLRTASAAAGRPVAPHDGAVDIAALRADYLAHAAEYRSMFDGYGTAVRSANAEVALDGLDSVAAKQRMTAWIESKGLGRAEVQYKLRDWLFSRQRYWGEPFPILHAPDGRIVPVAEDDLPVMLPEMDDFQPVPTDDPDAPPQPPLSRAPLEWRLVDVDGVTHERELNTMPNWAGSCWYYLRYIDPSNKERLVDGSKERYWMGDNGVDLYVGGVEHGVLHLLYARFWHKVLFDLGHVGTPEPFGKLFNQGYIQAYAFRDDRGFYVSAEEVEETDEGFVHNGHPVVREYGKMGKSLKNIVTPDVIIQRYGCDCLRLYEMYLGPLEQSKPWSTRDMVGISRFLDRLWRNFVAADGSLQVSDDAPDAELLRRLHVTIQRVTDDLEDLRFNTAIAALIELNNDLVGRDAVPRDVAVAMVPLLAPFAPHMAEELWSRLGHNSTVLATPWPEHDPRYLKRTTVDVVLQVNGKVRGKLTVAAEMPEAELEALALADPAVAQYSDGKAVVKVVVVPGKLVNIVVA
ncbi:MAG: leucine--tRNA ligase [Ardenticatenales bacterium]|nr:leucine--tRNA ligase [Ardenticatenales bacterium]